MSNVQKGFVDVPGARIYYEAEGTGPFVTLVHAGVADLRMWDEQVAAWRDGFRVVRYDTRGWGRTVVEDVPYSNVDDLRAVLDHVGAERTHLGGLSRGGGIALDFAVEYPERVTSLTWVAGGVRGFETEDDPRAEALGPDMERLEEARDWEQLVELETRLWTDGPGQPADRVDPEVRRKMFQMNLESYQADQPANQPIAPDVPAVERLDRLTMPVLVLWGTLDVTRVLRTGEMLARTLADVRSHVFDDVAHMVNMERPAEFNRMVREHMERAERLA